MTSLLTRLLSRTAYVKTLRQANEALQAELTAYQLGWPPGHFYSPLPDLADIQRREAAIFSPMAQTIPGMDLHEAGQIELLQTLAAYYPEQPFTATGQAQRRYFFENPNFTYGEAIILHALLRHVQPKRIIEIGAGYSSCVILDTAEIFATQPVAYTIIEPYPELLQTLLQDGDEERMALLARPLQDVDASLFATLAAGDILFVDSSHVSKVGSDVNHILFDILPALAEGVYVHFHDVGYPFEYPKVWIYEGRAWNEAYLLRAFLQYNRAFQIRYFNSFMGQFHADLLQQYMPLCLKNPGTSLWLQKIAS